MPVPNIGAATELLFSDLIAVINTATLILFRYRLTVHQVRCSSGTPGYDAHVVWPHHTVSRALRLEGRQRLRESIYRPDGGAVRLLNASRDSCSSLGRLSSCCISCGRPREEPPVGVYSSSRAGGGYLRRFGWRCVEIDASTLNTTLRKTQICCSGSICTTETQNGEMRKEAVRAGKGTSTVSAFRIKAWTEKVGGCVKEWWTRPCACVRGLTDELYGDRRRTQEALSRRVGHDAQFERISSVDQFHCIVSCPLHITSSNTKKHH